MDDQFLSMMINVGEILIGLLGRIKVDDRNDRRFQNNNLTQVFTFSSRVSTPVSLLLTSALFGVSIEEGRFMPQTRKVQ